MRFWMGSRSSKQNSFKVVSLYSFTSTVSFRKIDLQSHFDPKTLAQEAVGLNIGLMLWRAAPGLNPNTLVHTRCLLIGTESQSFKKRRFGKGMGTLGCCVARSLLGWGVRCFSLVDYGRVAFSNPVRQCLYEFEDCLEGGRYKAEAAAEHLKSIRPDIDVQSFTFKIPTPGHAPTSDVEIVASQKVP